MEYWKRSTNKGERYFYEMKNLRAACDPGRRLDANFNFHLFVALNGKDRENKGVKSYEFKRKLKVK